MERSWRLMLGFYTCWLMTFFLTAHMMAWAGPGGIIKDAAMTPLGRLGICVGAVLLGPFIAYYLIKREMQIRCTRRDLARLAVLHPQYQWREVKDRTTATFEWVWSAWSQQKMEAASSYTTTWYMLNQQMQLDEWAEKEWENVCRLDDLLSIEPILVKHNGKAGAQDSRLVVTIAARIVDYLQDKRTGEIIKGDKNVGVARTVWTFVWQENAWRLNLIEPSTTEWSYLTMPNELPASLTPQSSRT